MPAPPKDLGVLSDFVRKRRWLVGGTHRATAVIGSGVIDLREAQFTVTGVAVCGSVFVVRHLPRPRSVVSHGASGR